MPIITDMYYEPVPAVLEQPLSVEISLRVPSAGPVTICISLEEHLPYFFINGGNQVRELRFTRTFGSAGKHTARFMVSLMSMTSQPESDPSLTVTAAGIDGSSIPFKLVLGREQRG